MMNHTDIMIDRLKINMHVRHITHLSLSVMLYLKCFSVIETSNSEDDEHNHS